MRIFQQFKRKIKRHIDVYLFPKKVENQIKFRQGKCLRCGRCCKLVIRCPMLDESNGMVRCRIYTYRPVVCRLFPIHKDDLRDVDYKCGYSYPDQ